MLPGRSKVIDCNGVCVLVRVCEIVMVGLGLPHSWRPFYLELNHFSLTKLRNKERKGTEPDRAESLWLFPCELRGQQE